jgi:hypothetical protein
MWRRSVRARLAEDMTVQIYLNDTAQLGQLGQRLLADSSGAILAEYRNCFDEAAMTARQRLVEPLTPEQFAATQAIAESAALSADVLAAIWQSMHGGPAGRTSGPVHAC